ncbi:MAG: hypothetical protein A2V66_05435 [Ignavibacteria bacterium RBG_13_36_8]|nr:MAG: hypothetical protein A2V66_05435 [Ignavibacteria bacterium RBG_13_36_8]
MVIFHKSPVDRFIKNNILSDIGNLDYLPINMNQKWVIEERISTGIMFPDLMVINGTKLPRL